MIQSPATLTLPIGVLAPGADDTPMTGVMGVAEATGGGVGIGGATGGFAGVPATGEVTGGVGTIAGLINL